VSLLHIIEQRYFIGPHSFSPLSCPPWKTFGDPCVIRRADDSSSESKLYALRNITDAVLQKNSFW